MKDIELNRFIIEPTEDQFSDYRITCIISTPNGRVFQEYYVTNDFFNRSGLDYFLNKTINKYQDATK